MVKRRVSISPNGTRIPDGFPVFPHGFWTLGSVPILCMVDSVVPRLNNEEKKMQELRRHVL
jgi:hypothetical protein